MPFMNCMAVRCLYLKANGEIPCWCSPGEHHPVLRLDPERFDHADVVEDVLNGSALRGMRRALFEDRLPFFYCRGCFFLEEGRGSAFREVDPHTFALSRVEIFQVEASYLCNVDCPLCVRRAARRSSKSPPHQLPPALFRKTVDDLARHHIPVGELWFSGRGEPLMNPAFPELAAYGKERLACRVTCHTNGNFPFRDALLTCGLDEIEIALDGTTQEQYGRYRRGGSLEKVLAFSKAFAEAKRKAGRSRPEIVWKTILFEWNTRDEDLDRVLRWAGELGIDTVLFTATDTPGGASRKDGGRRLEEIRAFLEARKDRAAPRLRLQDFHSVFAALPDATLDLKVEVPPSKGEAHVLGRAFNQLLEPLDVRWTLRLEDEAGTPPRILADGRLVLPERSEQVDSLALPLHDLAPGEYRITASITRPDTGVLLAEAEAFLRVPFR